MPSRSKKKFPYVTQTGNSRVEFKLIISIEKNCTYADLCLELLHDSRPEWLNLYESQGGTYPDFSTWEQFRDAVVEGAQRFWQIAHPEQMPEVGKPSAKKKCYQAIVEGLYQRFPNWNGQAVPLVKEKPISQYQLIKMIRKRHPKLTESTCRKFARMWLLSWKFLEPNSLLPSDIGFLKKYSPELYAGLLQTWKLAEAIQENERGNPQKLLEYIQLRHPL